LLFLAVRRTIAGVFLLLSCENGQREIVEYPLGSDIDALAQQHGARIYDFCASKADAERRLAKNPNGKPFWI